MVNRIVPIAVVLVIVGVIAAFTIIQVSSNASQATIIVQNGTFNPDNLTVKAGTTVTWINQDSNTKHKIRSSDFMSDDLTSGQSYSYTFNKPGTYLYHDHLHMDNKNMIGTIIVQ